MASSDWFRRGALAPAGIEIGPTPGTQTRTIVAAEEVRRHGQRQLLPHYSTQIDRVCRRWQDVSGRIVGRFGIVAEEDVQILVQMVNQLGQAAPAAGLDVGRNVGPPKVLTRSGRLEPPRNRHRPGKPELEPLEDWIVRLKPPDRVDRTPVKSTEVDLKHSRLS
jgi:hypothetical protein